jgi:hypothetical protein
MNILLQKHLLKVLQCVDKYMYRRLHTLLPKDARRGYIAFISVVIISAIGVSLMLSVITAGVNASKTDFALQQLSSARSMASSCAEEALQQIFETGTTSSSGNLTIASGTCTYLILSNNGQNITIRSIGTLGTVTSKVLVLVASTSPFLSLSSWEEVADF